MGMSRVEVDALGRAVREARPLVRSAPHVAGCLERLLDLVARARDDVEVAALRRRRAVDEHRRGRGAVDDLGGGHVAGLAASRSARRSTSEMPITRTSTI